LENRSPAEGITRMAGFPIEMTILVVFSESETSAA
jgi:hypothetical protein